MIKKIMYILGTIGAITIPVAGTVHAEEVGEYGAVITYSPVQAGLAPKKLGFFPWLQKEFDNGWYAIVRQGFGKYVVKNDTTKVGIGLWADLGRKPSDHKRLEGLKKIKISPAININFSRQLSGRNSVTGFIETSVREHKGTRAQVAFTRLLTANTDSMLFTSGDIYTQFVDTKYAEAYYGVTAEDATNSGLSEYTASSGIDRIGARYNVQKNINDKLYVKGTLSMGVTSGPAKASPISDKTSYMGIAIVFGTYF